MKLATRKFAETANKLNFFGRVTVFALSAILLASCTELRQPTVEPYYAETVPPPKQELRWSNGKAPKSLDPARATAAPETDIVRAIYEGLTDLDSRSLHEIPGVAERWESSDDLRTWTFSLRKDAKWSNDERVTARDFVASFKRLLTLPDRSASSYLFQNIVGMGLKAAETDSGQPGDFLRQTPPDSVISGEMLQDNDLLPRSQMSVPQPPVGQPVPSPTSTPQKKVPAPPTFGVEAVDDFTLKVSLELPDKDFPKLVSNPVFRPVYANGDLLDGPRLDPATITNGAFRITKIADDGITLERSELYWNRKSIALEQIRFVPTSSAESALDAYRRGEIDVITNASFEPLALKLLTPYEDFRRTTHSALNFYEFNLKNAPFSDRRIREALAIAIDRERLAEGELEGSVEPANKFLPLSENKKADVMLDVEHAKESLAAAGFPNGEGFPKIRLVINRNDLQQRVARAIARMWKQNLNVETQIIVKEAAEIDSARKTGDFDLVRRGVVLLTADEWISLSAIFDFNRALPGAVTAETGAEAAPLNNPTQPAPAGKGPMDDESIPESSDPKIAAVSSPARFTEQAAIFEMRAIPLYFPKSYALVKPYVNGFEMNALDAMSLKDVSIDNTWQPKTVRSQL